MGERHRFVCEMNHTIVTDEENPVGTCPVPVHADGRLGVHVGQGDPDYKGCAACRPCGGDLEYRLVPYDPPASGRDR